GEANADRQRLVLLQQQEDEKRHTEAEAAKMRADNNAALTRSLQAELKRVGCDPGAVVGGWGAKAKEALHEFGRTAKVTLSAEEPTEEALQAVAAHKGRVCVLTCSANERERNGR